MLLLSFRSKCLNSSHATNFLVLVITFHIEYLHSLIVGYVGWRSWGYCTCCIIWNVRQEKLKGCTCCGTFSHHRLLIWFQFHSYISICECVNTKIQLGIWQDLHKMSYVWLLIYYLDYCISLISVSKTVK